MRNQCVCALVVGLALQQMLGAESLQAPSAVREFSCEAFPRDTGEAQLIARYGRENVRPAGIVGWDDGPQDGTVVFPDDEGLKLEIIWADPGSRHRIDTIRTRGLAGRWRSPDGITVGMALKTIEQRNGWPFRLSRFWGEGYPGQVLSWGNGRFTANVPGGCSVYIYLLPPEGVAIDRAVRRQLNVRELSSGHPAMQAVNPRVYQMLIWYRGR
jgi:hypothetical protein